MNRSYFQRLEQAFAEASDLHDQAAQSEFCRRLAQHDTALADELRMMLAIRDEADELFAPERDHFSLLLASLGDAKRTESGQELLEFLSSVSESQREDEIASIRGFSIRKLVAIGATGFVFRGIDRRLQRDVAVKVLAPSIARDPDRRKAFTEEARLASTVRHPNVVTIHHVSDEPNSTLVFYVMDWVDGVLLQELVTAPPSDGAQFLKLLRQIGDGVDAIHAKGIVHRDLKPGNMIVSPSGDLTIVDFGLALEENHAAESSSPAGTPLYMSPEQLLGKDLTHQTDIFSITEIACVLLTGKHPYPATSIAELSQLVLEGVPEIETASRELAQALSKGLCSEPLHRYETASALVDSCLATLPVADHDVGTFEALPHSAVWALSPWSRVAASLCAIAAVTLIGLVVWWPEPDQERLKTSGTTEIESAPEGEWIDENHYRNFADMDFVRIRSPRSEIDSWPPVSGHPELFQSLGWANQRKDMLVGSRLITCRQYLDVMGQLPAGVSVETHALDAPVTQVSFHDASSFCERLSEADPDDNHYGVCGVNAWTLAVYGSQLLRDEANTSQVMSAFRSFSRGGQPGQATAEITPLIQETLGNHWEWSTQKFRKPTVLEGVVSYSKVPEQTNDPLREVLGGATSDIFLHAHDMWAGMNDHFQSGDNLEFHTEEDGETCYLHPIRPNQRAYLRYRYSTRAPIIDARVLVPFSLYNEHSSAGIRVRSRSKDGQSIDSYAWEDAYYQRRGKLQHSHGTEFVDLTSYVANATEVEIEYWLTTDNSAPVRYTQLGRTSSSLATPRVFCFEATTDGRNESPRQFVPIPESHRSKRIGFRIQVTLRD